MATTDFENEYEEYEELEEGDSEQGEDQEDPYAKMRMQVFEEVTELLAKEDTDNPVYKGLQRHLSEREQRLQRQNQELEQLRNQSSHYETSLSDLREGMEFLQQELVANLGDEERERLQARLNEKRLERLEREKSQPPPVQNQQSNSEAEAYWNQLNQQIADYERKFRKQAEDLVKELGGDPKDDGIPYGSYEDGKDFGTRMGEILSYVRSKRDQKDEETVDSVRRKSPPSMTRGAGIEGRQRSNEPDDHGDAALRQGAEDLLGELRKKLRAN